MNVSSTSSLAVQQRPDAAALFKRTDANGDGKITKDELTTALENSPQKAKGGNGPSADDLFSKLDADGDGAITETEQAAGLAEMESKHGGPPSSGVAGSSSMVDTLKQLLEALQKKNADSADQTSDTEDTASASTATSASTNSDTDVETLIKQLVAELKKNSETAGVLRAVA
jgi:type VI protein secretion system component VasK